MQGFEVYKPIVGRQAGALHPLFSVKSTANKQCDGQFYKQCEI